MKRTVMVFGLISGLLITAMMIYSTASCYSTDNFEGSEVLGYTGMLVAFSVIFVGIKNYRDKYNNGVITFAEAFKTGLFIALIGSSFYVAVWLIEYYVFFPDFMDKYCTHMIKQASDSGLQQPELDKKAAQLTSLRKMYQNPLLVVLLTYLEVLPIGLVVTLISALLLKKRGQRVAIA